MVETVNDETFPDLARGCIFGALCGDALGAYLEFETRVTNDQVNVAMQMPGGGPFKLASGQITDDGELTLCLGRGLVKGNGSLDLNEIGSVYGDWLHSNPFDVGITISNAVSFARRNPNKVAENMRQGAQQSLDSQSNGSLMRITPLVVWASKLSKENFITAIREETKLTHPNRTALDVSVLYAYTIQHLLRNKGDYQGAYNKCMDLVKELKNEVVTEWISELESNNLPIVNQKIGWVKIAFLYSLKYLRENKSYSDAMREMLKQGGDTDTNCCIVGGILGALHGIEGIPKEYIEKMLQKEGRKHLRPDFLIPGKVIEEIIQKITQLCPTTLNLEGASPKAFNYVLGIEGAESAKKGKKSYCGFC